MEKNILIEEQDEVLRLIDQKELDEIEASAEEFDGFTGIRIVGRVQPEVKVQIAEILKELFDKYTEEKRNNYNHTEFYVGGLQDGKLVALAEIKERLSNLSA